jgi:hypothetical protein
MTTATYPIHITIKSPSPVVLTPELEGLVERVFEEWREDQQDQGLRQSIESDDELIKKLTLMKRKLAL